MRKHLSRILKFLKKGWVIATLVVVIIIAALIFGRGGKASNIEFAIATMDNVVEKVSVTGKISPLAKAELSFEKSGAVTKVLVKVGDKVKKGDVLATLNSADDAAALASAQAGLAEVSRGLRPEELASNEAALNTASTTLLNARKDAVNAVRDGYVKAQSAIVNYADTFFTNPQSVNPTIKVRTQSTNSEIAINNSRFIITETLINWKKDIDANVSNTLSIDILINKSGDYLNKIKAFLSDLSFIINDLSPGNSGSTQSAIDTYTSTMNTSLTVMNQANSAVTSADTVLNSAISAYSQALNKFTLEKAGSSPENISAQSAKVEQVRAQLAKNRIVSPIDGIVTKADPSVGEFVAVGQTSFAVQSAGSFKIEAYVPEADIAKITLGNNADVTLDAYGSNTIFPATVITVDPAETILEGVPTYKVTLQFTTPDERIRSGMTANTEILTRRVDNVLVVPTRAVIDDAGSKTVRLLRSDGKTFDIVPVEAGLKGSDGTIEIKSGIVAGDKVVTYVK